jgi:hypothetical protein
MNKFYFAALTTSILAFAAPEVVSAITYKTTLLTLGSGDAFAGRNSETSQVGTDDNRAALWSGTADSMVDLHPVGFDESAASDVSGASQVGSGYSKRPGCGAPFCGAALRKAWWTCIQLRFKNPLR